MTEHRKSVLFVLPGYCSQPVGGYKVVFDYANMLNADGYQVSIAYASFIGRCFLHKKWKEKLRILKRLIVGYQGFSARKWFPLHENITELFPRTLAFSNELKADIYIATACVTARAVASYPQGKKVYFIQGYENWDMNDEELRQTYELPMKKVVVSNWLRDILNSKGIKCTVVRNGFDPQEYYLTKPIEEKRSNCISVMYSPAYEKGFDIVLKVLEKIRKNHEITVTAFGAYPAQGLPSWIQYDLGPSHERHLQINNDAGIYLSASRSEGWGLTIGEAMMCGQAVVCTATKGFLEMAVDGRNAIVSPIDNVDALVKAIEKLLEDNELRVRLAQQGLEDIRSYKIEDSYQQFRKALEE